MTEDYYRQNQIVEVFEWLGENWIGVLIFLYIATCVVRCGWSG